jgi:hypothetical protein
MRISTRFVVLLSLALVVGPASVWAIDPDIEVRVNAASQSAQKARIEAALKIKADADRKTKELEARLAEVQQWTQAQFELSQREVIDKPKAMTELMQRWQKAQEREIYQLLQFPERSGGAIESGRALNALLARVGPAAHQTFQTRRINAAHALPLYEPTAAEQIDLTLFNQLTLEDKTLGAKESRKGNEGPIDIDWPTVLRDPRWVEHCRAVEAARAKVLAELATTTGLSPGTDKELRQAVARLNADFADYRKKWVHGDDTAGTRSFEYRRLCDGTRHIQKLIASVYQVLEARSLRDLPTREVFPGGNVEAFLSFLQRNNLQFGPAAKGTDRKAYYRIFDMMVRYYLDFNAAVKLEQFLEQEVILQKQISRDALDVALGKAMSGADRAAILVEELKFVRGLIAD